MEYIRNNWHGELSLKLTFYFNFLAVDVVALIPWSYMKKASMNGDSYGFMIYLFVLLLITCWSAVGVFSCVAKIGKEKSTKNIPLSVFEKLAVTFALVWLLMIVFQSYASIKHSNADFHNKHTNSTQQLPPNNSLNK